MAQLCHLFTLPHVFHLTFEFNSAVTWIFYFPYYCRSIWPWIQISLDFFFPADYYREFNQRNSTNVSQIEAGLITTQSEIIYFAGKLFDSSSSSSLLTPMIPHTWKKKKKLLHLCHPDSLTSCLSLCSISQLFTHFLFRQHLLKTGECWQSLLLLLLPCHPNNFVTLRCQLNSQTWLSGDDI